MLLLPNHKPKKEEKLICKDSHVMNDALSKEIMKKKNQKKHKNKKKKKKEKKKVKKNRQKKIS